MNDTSKVTPPDVNEISLNELRARQSVRTTFKLPSDTINLLGLIAGQLGIKQKSLLDQLTEDKQLLHRLAKEFDGKGESNSNRMPKTFVMNRSTLQSINEVARQKKVPRDVLVEFSIKRLVPVIEMELKKHSERKKIFREMKEHLQEGERLRKQALGTLGENDEMYNMLDKQVMLARKNIARSQGIIEKGSPMEEW